MGQGKFSREMVSVKKTDCAALEGAGNLRATARRLGQACAAERVILFGSRATGRASADSDVDLALILPDGSNARATLNVAHRLLWPESFRSIWLRSRLPCGRRNPRCWREKLRHRGLCSTSAARINARQANPQ